ncbi:MAG: glycosyltransferase family 4 protein [Candidatus Heimdallarchaeota archaeon]|nr:glycosyltransferase family 4 protein [Candidatus Heimdallarchaeota archaeon]MCK5047910.1 glycosyltransferase family 4 protein [Candidatus Heimdallarchaeota archaeon]
MIIYAAHGDLLIHNGLTVRVRKIVKELSKYSLIGLISAHKIPANDPLYDSVEWIYSLDHVSDKKELINPRAYWKALKDCLTIAKLSKKEDIIYTDGPYYPLAKLFTSSKLFLELHGIVTENLVNKEVLKKSGFVYHLSKTMERFLVKRTSGVISVTPGLKEYANDHFNYSLNRQAVIPNGVDTELYQQVTEKEIQKVKEKLDIQDSFTLGFIGAFRAWHGMENLILTLERVKKEVKNAKLVLIGDGDHKDKLVELAEKRGVIDSVVFTGFIDHSKVPSILKALDVGVYFPHTDLTIDSLRRKFGESTMKIYEYMAASLPVVTTPIPNMSSTVKQSKGGRVVKRDIEAFSKAIIELAQSPKERKELGRRGQKFVHEHFQWKEIARQIWEFISKE